MKKTTTVFLSVAVAAATANCVGVVRGAVPTLQGGGIAEKYYRLAIREVKGGDIGQLGEFSLYAADGSRVNGGGMKLVEPRPAKALAPGECFASQKNFARETADKLFDGNPKTKLCVGKLALRERDPASWLNVYFRLPDGAKPVAKYNFCSADDTDRYPERNPKSWAIWCSADGETWRLVDERTGAFSPKSMLTWWNGSRPYSFGGERPCEDMADEVNPFIGAVTQHPRSALGGHGLGKTFPGAATPCGMVQLSPDTVTGGDNGCGYSYHHETIEGFSFTHLSGVGWYGDFGNFQVMPTAGARSLDRDKAKSAYSHEREVAEAGYYAVTLDRYGIRAEMAAAPRAGILRFTFPESKEARVQIDLGRRIGQLGRWLKHSRQHVRVVDDHTIEGRMECPWEDGGWGHGAGRVHYVVNFACAFSKPFRRFGVWDKDEVFEGCRDYTGTNTGFFAEFETAKDEQILVRAGLSYVDLDGARKNLASDIPDFDFDRVRRSARALWSDAFAGVKVKGGSADDRAVFATCLYHALIDPRAVGDVDGRYMGSDGRIYRDGRFTARTVFSGWDVFRSEMPLLTLIRPDIVDDTISSMLRWNELGPRDTLPVWDLFGCTSGCMVGNPIIPCIADAYEKGIRNWDAETAWRLADATSRKRGNADCGWTPNSISVTLEYAYDDWCMGRFAEMLGRKEDAKRYYGRAGWYRNIWSKEAGWMRSRKADGTWTPWRGRHVHGQGAVESNPWQQGWFVPHDIYGLIELVGGERKFAEELEQFFEKAPPNFLWGDCYNHPNEVTHLVPFMFPYCGKPWLTQKWTRRICEGAYGNEVYGYVGNEDEGQMSAWYILAASGLHPACPGSGVWILTSPVFPEVSFRLDPKYAKGGSFTIRANGVSKENIYIRSAKLNGKPLGRAWITTKEVSDGGLLELEMDAEPAKKGFAVPEPANVPDLLTTSAGEKVATAGRWESVRAPELLALFEREVYGRRPAAADERGRVSFETCREGEAFGGKAICKHVRVTYDGPNGRHSFPVTAYIPKAVRPAPAFVYAAIDFYTKYDADGAVATSEYWPVEKIIDRGYATAAFSVIRVAADKPDAGFSQGVFQAVEPEGSRGPDSWATISAWAWGASRVMDWMETEPLIDAKHVGVAGHSRGGKTALWTGVTDKRFAMACSNESGCGGAKLNHITLPRSESIDVISDPKRFHYWFCRNFRKYAGKEMSMDFDQHELIALIAPRLVCVGSATEDRWAGPLGEWWSAKLASPAWELYGKKGLVADKWPDPETPQQEGCVSYHLRTGKHFLTPYDWDRYMDFADRHCWRAAGDGAGRAGEYRELR